MRMLPNKILAVVFLLTCSITPGNGQVRVKPSKNHPENRLILHVGDKIPNRYFNVNNYKDKKIRLSDIKANLIILDMWGTYCGSCIDHMPEIVALQKEFKDSIQVLMVTKNSDVEVKKCAIRAENVRKNSLPFINGKENLAGYFNLSFVPQYIWIDKQGTIKYISEESYVSKPNIRKFLKGKALSFKVKRNIPDPNVRDPLLVQMYPYLGNAYYMYSYLAPLDFNQYTSGSLEVNGLDMQNSKSISGNSFNFKSLYKMAYGYSDRPISNDRILINFNDTANFSDPAKIYIYEIKANNKISKERILKHIQSELNLFFNVNSVTEKRSVNCLILKKLDNGNSFYTTKTDTNHFDKVNNSILKITLPWGKFLIYTNGLKITPPHTIIDETGIDPKRIVDFQMSINFGDMEEVRKSLAPYGLTMVEESRKLDCIVINNIN
ncbi:TlpA family protein disulfide reductase [Mucilaginibacter sp. FT3.2]|uniref:TlpA family protein disulfide reductase n=1 Tax=Mucilaginibacter sp. FT3.2 TaxID=2723090 RepID=UPI001615B4EB|nr:redoxin domain-containing protein [Mucilaginibacter sp. FT3.2]MBB6232488.1 thiol-disulfide isomerase/thioredoxin [Mucilaginibacter sp. FT3.2]